MTRSLIIGMGVSFIMRTELLSTRELPASQENRGMPSILDAVAAVELLMSFNHGVSIPRA